MPTYSDTNMTPLGLDLPDAVLVDADGGEHQLHELAGDGPVLLAFLANHCPYVKHIENVFGAVTGELAGQGLSVVGVASNDVDDYPEDGFGGMAEQAARAGWSFPYLLDPGQALALKIGAVCTPDLFLFDGDRKLVYRGAFDGSSPKNGVELTGEDLRAAADAVLSGGEVPADQRPAMGCGIKWSEGNAPE